VEGKEEQGEEEEEEGVCAVAVVERPSACWPVVLSLHVAGAGAAVGESGPPGVTVIESVIMRLRAVRMRASSCAMNSWDVAGAAVVIGSSSMSVVDDDGASGMERGE
jgi:hypothetical protein